MLRTTATRSRNRRSLPGPAPPLYRRKPQRLRQGEYHLRSSPVRPGRRSQRAGVNGRALEAAMRRLFKEALWIGSSFLIAQSSVAYVQLNCKELVKSFLGRSGPFPLIVETNPPTNPIIPESDPTITAFSSSAHLRSRTGVVRALTIKPRRHKNTTLSVTSVGQSPFDLFARIHRYADFTMILSSSVRVTPEILQVTSKQPQKLFE